MGQKIDTKKLLSNNTVLTNQYVSGVNFVTVSNELTKSVTHKLDNAISLALQSAPPEGSDETVNNFNTNEFKNNPYKTFV